MIKLKSNTFHFVMFVEPNFEKAMFAYIKWNPPTKKQKGFFINFDNTKWEHEEKTIIKIYN